MGSLVSFIKVILVSGCKKPRHRTSISRPRIGVVFIAGVPSRQPFHPSLQRESESLLSTGFILFIVSALLSFVHLFFRPLLSLCHGVRWSCRFHRSRDKLLYNLVVIATEWSWMFSEIEFAVRRNYEIGAQVANCAVYYSIL